MTSTAVERALLTNDTERLRSLGKFGAEVRANRKSVLAEIREKEEAEAQIEYLEELGRRGELVLTPDGEEGPCPDGDPSELLKELRG